MAQPEPATDEERIEKVRAMIKSLGSALMVTRSATGGMQGRPMATAEVQEGLETLWFATDRNSGKVEAIEADDHVFLGYADRGGSDSVCITGRARIVDDRAKIKELYSPAWKNWFDGPDDPRITLIAVTPETAEYWDAGNRVIAYAKFATAAITGKKFNLGEHEKIEIAPART